ncbi:MAG: LysE family translocator [Betaproteobacteria bacterium]|nr:MAG: LysE family translocator [Betaproteobacteria bacterium]
MCTAARARSGTPSARRERASWSRSSAPCARWENSTQSLALFALASVLLVLTPGPNLLYLVSRALCQGRSAGVVSLSGTSLGFVFHVVAAALGLSAIFLTVPLLYDAMRYLGAAYLLWLAWEALKPGGKGVFAPRALPPDPPARLFRIGLLTSILNPKVAMFYLALFPQFIDPQRGSVLVQSLVLGLLQIAISVVGDLCFVLAASAITGALARRPLWAAAQRWVLGVVLAAIAVRLAFDSRK